MKPRIYILDRDGSVLDGSYSRREEAEAVAEREYRARGRYAAVMTLDEWNRTRPFRFESPRCPYCDRVMSHREKIEQGACDYCYGDGA